MRISALLMFATTCVAIAGADDPKLVTGRIRESRRQRLAALFLAPMLAVSSVSLSAQATAALRAASDVALVTFFSNPPDMLGNLSGKSEPFNGNLFVGKEEVARMKAGRFVTIWMIPGAYEFTAATWMANGPAGGSHLKLNLVAHHHYYVELRNRMSFPFTNMFGIKEVACEEASSGNVKDKPIDASALMSAGKDNLVAESAFPACPESD
jgi:hypothetical protein